MAPTSASEAAPPQPQPLPQAQVVGKPGSLYGAVFDLDGTLLDTEGTSQRSIDQAVSAFGKHHSKALHKAILGRPGVDWTRMVIDALSLHGLIEPTELVHQAEHNMHAMMAEVQVLPGALQLLRELHAREVPMALATSSNSQAVEYKRQFHPEVFAYFSVIVCGNDPELTRGKPEPDIFLLAAKRLYEKTRAGENDPIVVPRCVVFEDSVLGVQAGKSANMHTVAIPDPRYYEDASEREALYQHADAIITSLEQFSLEEHGCGDATAASADPKDPNALAMEEPHAKTATRTHRAAARLLASLVFLSKRLASLVPNRVKVASKRLVRAALRLRRALYDKRHGYMSVQSKHLHYLFLVRETIEIASQSYQMYNSSRLLARPWISALFLSLVVTNCWSTPILQHALAHSSGLERVLCLVLDGLLDAGSAIYILLIVFIPYAQVFDTESLSFPSDYLYDPQWFVNMVRENRMLFAMSGKDLFSKLVPHHSLYSCMKNVKKSIVRKQTVAQQRYDPGNSKNDKDGASNANASKRGIRADEVSLAGTKIASLPSNMSSASFAMVDLVLTSNALLTELPGSAPKASVLSIENTGVSAIPSWSSSSSASPGAPGSLTVYAYNTPYCNAHSTAASTSSSSSSSSSAATTSVVTSGTTTTTTTTAATATATAPSDSDSGGTASSSTGAMSSTTVHCETRDPSGEERYPLALTTATFQPEVLDVDVE